MYGLPTTFDPSFLKGKKVETISFAGYQVNLYLEGMVWIQIEGHYTLTLGSEVIESVCAFPLSQSLLLQLIGREVHAVTFSSKSGDLEVMFEGVYSLFIKGDIGPYESYRLFDGQRELIV